MSDPLVKGNEDSGNEIDETQACKRLCMRKISIFKIAASLQERLFFS